MPLRTDEDVMHLRRHVRQRALAIKLSLVDQTKLVTAASELARNTIKYGGGGEVLLERLDDGMREGVALLFIDGGPGIADLDLALTDGYTSGNGLGQICPDRGAWWMNLKSIHGSEKEWQYLSQNGNVKFFAPVLIFSIPR